MWHAVPACTITMLHELSLVASRNLLTRSDHLGVKWMQPPVTLACRVLCTQHGLLPVLVVEYTTRVM